MNKILTVSKRFIKKNSSTILTCAGAAGVVGTAVLAVKATPKALKLIEEAEREKGDELSKWEVVQVTAPTYIPAVLLGMGTITCIFGAHVLNKRNQAALTSAYALLDQTHKEYKNKVKEMYGEGADQEVKAELAKDKYKDADIDEEYELPLFYDEFSKRYFNAKNEDILYAEYEINKLLNTNGVVSLNDYYNLVGLDPVDYGEYLGWSSAQMYEHFWDDWLYFHHTKVEMDDGLECYIIDYTEPFANYLDY